jgi:hypothetical protein
MTSTNHQDFNLNQINVKMNPITHISKLGLEAKDRVTGLTGVITSVSFDLYGCIQYLLQPGADKGTDWKDSYWLDSNRVDFLSDQPVMDQPNYIEGDVAEGKKGPAMKPIRN